MSNFDQGEEEQLLQLIAEINMTVTSMYALQCAFMATHQDLPALKLAFESQMERHMARGLGSALSDATLAKLDAHRLRILSDIDVAAKRQALGQ